MILQGRITKRGDDYSVIVDLLSCYAGGKSKEQALAQVAGLVKHLASQDGESVEDLEVVVTEDGEHVYVSTSDSARLIGVLLRHQREAHELSMADVAARMGLKQRSTYAYYEHGVEPSPTRLQELLAVVAPELVLAVIPRGAAVTLQQRPIREKGRRGPAAKVPKATPKRKRAA